LGPIIGGAFTNGLVGWRWAFYINLYASAVYAAICLFALPNKDPHPRVSPIDRAWEIDYVEAALLFSAFASGFIAVSFGGIAYL
jgi:MFS family permease